VLVHLEQTTGERIEPSAAAGFLGPARMVGAGQANYLSALHSDPALVTHLFWTTGGAFVPEDEYWRFHQQGRALIQR
jgi:D-serine dehydratase